MSSERLGSALQSSWADVVLLLFFNALFFGLALLSFNRYDVR
jgi:ABC-type transport system involved in multi-copper enzyme maturation permease subunit